MTGTNTGMRGPDRDGRASGADQPDASGPSRSVTLVTLLIALAVAATLGGVSGALLSWRIARPVQVTPAIVGPPLSANVVSNALVVALSSVVRVTAWSSWSASPTGGGTQESTVGTGLIVSADGRIVTAAHVVDRPETVVAVTVDGSSEPIPASIVAVDLPDDLALLQIEGATNLPSAAFSSTAAGIGTNVVALGFALGMAGPPTATEGIISATGRSLSVKCNDGSIATYQGLLQTDAPLTSGQSGGPLLDVSGHVVGLIEGSAPPVGSATIDNIGFAIPSSTIAAALAQMEQELLRTPP